MCSQINLNQIFRSVFWLHKLARACIMLFCVPCPPSVGSSICEIWVCSKWDFLWNCYYSVCLMVLQPPYFSTPWRWCSEARKVTVGLALHWQFIIDFVVHSTHLCAQRPKTGRWAATTPFTLSETQIIHWHTVAFLEFHLLYLTMSIFFVSGVHC